MDAGDALLQEILEHPDDDVPRLVYADWLDDTGGQPEQARAEFIRLQVLLAGLPGEDERRPELEARERRLRKRHARAWLGPMRLDVHDCAFERGFVVHLSLDAVSLLRWQDQIARSEPVRSVHLTSARQREVLECLAALPFLERLAGLDLSNNYLDRAGVAPLLNSPYLGRLQTLKFNDNPYGYDAVEAVANSPDLAGLVALEMRRNNLT